MWVIVKKLGGPETKIEVEENWTVLRLKECVEEKIGVAIEQQRLMLRGKSLLDESSIKDNDVTESCKIVLSVRSKAIANARAVNASQIPSKPNLSEELLKFLSKHYTDKDARLIVDEFKKDTYRIIHSMSLDDIERLATHNLHSS